MPCPYTMLEGLAENWLKGDKMTECKWHKKIREEIIERYENKGCIIESSHEYKVIVPGILNFITIKIVAYF